MLNIKFIVFVDKDRNDEEIYSKRVRAGKRTYFFDVKSTRSNDYYLTITESKRKYNADGGFYYEKHKVFLYKEDFFKFENALLEAVNYIKKELMSDVDFSQFEKEEEDEETNESETLKTDMDSDISWD